MCLEGEESCSNDSDEAHCKLESALGSSGLSGTSGSGRGMGLIPYGCVIYVSGVTRKCVSYIWINWVWASFIWQAEGHIMEDFRIGVKEVWHARLAGSVVVADCAVSWTEVSAGGCLGTAIEILNPANCLDVAANFTVSIERAADATSWARRADGAVCNVTLSTCNTGAICIT